MVVSSSSPQAAASSAIVTATAVTTHQFLRLVLIWSPLSLVSAARSGHARNACDHNLEQFHYYSRHGGNLTLERTVAKYRDTHMVASAAISLTAADPHGQLGRPAGTVSAVIRLYDTLTRQVTELQPRTPGEVSIYVCGPTVYDVPHLGHARTALTYDVLCRYLRWRGLTVRMVSNITDVDDKIIARAAEEGSTEEQVAARFTDVYLRETAALGVAEPDERPHATGYITEMVDFVEELLRRDAAYVIDGAGVYFDVSRYPDYGRLPRRRPDELRDSAGARVAVDERKRDPLDFALWKAAKPSEPVWDAPWMPGRPGWHIECVAMSLGLLGDGFDIHGGGSDLIFPHHENERAEAEAAGRRFARLWMHSAMVNVGGEKMAKSAGNFRTLADVLALYDPRALRLAMLQAHYRSTMEIDEAVLTAATAGIERLDAFARRIGAFEASGTPKGTDATGTVDTDAGREAFVEAMTNDLATPGAVGAIFELLRGGNVALDRGEIEEATAALATVRDLAAALGLHVGPAPLDAGAPSDRGLTDSVAGSGAMSDAAIQQRVDERQTARAARDYATADRIRGELADLCVEVEDTPAGTVWRRVT